MHFWVFGESGYRVLEVLGLAWQAYTQPDALFTGLADLVSERQLPSFVFSGIAYILKPTKGIRALKLE